eukprot:6212143-Lingulodinium_polyedra.AAC.1
MRAQCSLCGHHLRLECNTYMRSFNLARHRASRPFNAQLKGKLPWECKHQLANLWLQQDRSESWAKPATS